MIVVRCDGCGAELDVGCDVIGNRIDGTGWTNDKPFLLTVVAGVGARNTGQACIDCVVIAIVDLAIARGSKMRVIRTEA